METKNIKQEFLENFIPQEFPEYLLKIKEEAEKTLQNLAFPTTRDEQWKYTRISKILKKKYTQTPAHFSKKKWRNFMVETRHALSLPQNAHNAQNAHTFVFINGFFSTEFSKIGKETGTIIQPLSLARKEYPEILEKYFGRIASHKTEVFTALNTVYHTNGVFIFLHENAHLKKPVHIVNIGASENAGFNPRNLIILGRNSSANIIFSYRTLNSNQCNSFANVVTEIFSEENSQLKFYLLQQENEKSFQVNTTDALMKSNSKSEFFTFTTGGNMVRNNLRVSMEGENCEAHLNGLYVGTGEQHFDNHTLAEHKKPNSFSNELYKGIMNEKSTGVFNGKIFVAKDAQKTNAYQQNQNILLSDDATVDSKPELEIYANDVKCSHGSTTGQLDEEAIFYLQSRGIAKEKAKQLLIRAFANDVIEKISLVQVKNQINECVEKSIEQ